MCTGLCSLLLWATDPLPVNKCISAFAAKRSNPQWTACSLRRYSGKGLAMAWESGMMMMMICWWVWYKTSRGGSESPQCSVTRANSQVFPLCFSVRDINLLLLYPQFRSKGAPEQRSTSLWVCLTGLGLCKEDWKNLAWWVEIFLVLTVGNCFYSFYLGFEPMTKLSWTLLFILNYSMINLIHTYTYIPT